MTLVQSLFLGLVQGVTEFLPVSSSGHLNLSQHFLGLTPSLSFDIFLNTATLLSVIFFFRQQIKFFIDNLLQIIIGSIPAVIIGLLFKNQIEVIFSDVHYLPLFFLITTILVFSTRFTKSKSDKISLKQALIIGIFQSLAILPGVSRSGSTIFAGLLLGLSPLTAFNFSFSLFIPASLGALVLDLKSFTLNPSTIPAFVVTFIVGVLALYILKKTVIGRQFWKFSFYTLILASILPFVL